MSWLLLPFTLPYNFRLSDDVCIEYKELCKYSILFSKWDVVNEQSASTKYKEQNTEDIGIYCPSDYTKQRVDLYWNRSQNAFCPLVCTLNLFCHQAVQSPSFITSLWSFSACLKFFTNQILCIHLTQYLFDYFTGIHYIFLTQSLCFKSIYSDSFYISPLSELPPCFEASSLPTWTNIIIS